MTGTWYFIKKKFSCIKHNKFDYEGICLHIMADMCKMSVKENKHRQQKKNHL
jgi:hypothetical protein